MFEKLTESKFNFLNYNYNETITGQIKYCNQRHYFQTSKRVQKLPVTKIPEFANNVDLDEVAHDEPPHLDLHCLPSSL